MDQRTHRQKVDRLIAELKERGVSASTVAPPLFRLYWALGLNTPPPFYLGFVQLLLLMGIPCGVLSGGAIWLLVWRDQRMPGVLVVGAGAGMSLLFAAGMACYYGIRGFLLQLPPWESYPET